MLRQTYRNKRSEFILVLFGYEFVDGFHFRSEIKLQKGVDAHPETRTLIALISRLYLNCISILNCSVVSKRQALYFLSSIPCSVVQFNSNYIYSQTTIHFGSEMISFVHAGFALGNGASETRSFEYLVYSLGVLLCSSYCFHIYEHLLTYFLDNI